LVLQLLAVALVVNVMELLLVLVVLVGVERTKTRVGLAHQGKVLLVGGECKLQVRMRLAAAAAQRKWVASELMKVVAMAALGQNGLHPLATIMRVVAEAEAVLVIQMQWGVLAALVVVEHLHQTILTQ
jgi:hypothetical protein